MTTAAPPALFGEDEYQRTKGRREPAYRLIPPAHDRSAGREAIELLRRIDVTPDPWQEDVLEAFMGRDRAGRWVADEVALIVPRQNGKTIALLGRTLWGIVPRGVPLTAGFGDYSDRLALFSAHQYKTAVEAFLTLVSWCQHPELAALKPRITKGRGSEEVGFADGGRCAIIARSQVSGRGFSPGLVIADEAFVLDDLAMASLKPAMSAAAHAQLWYASSAPHDASSVLRRVCLAGRAGEQDTLAYLEWCAPLECDPADPHAWAAANPALGRRLTERYTISERRTLSAEDFARERLGLWQAEAVLSVFGPGNWQGCTDEGAAPPAGARTAIAVDVAPDRSRSSIGAAGALADGRTLIQLLDSRQGVPWVVGAVADLVRAHGPGAVLVDDAGQSRTLIAPLEAAGVKVTRTNAADMVAACGNLFDRVIERRLAHLGQAGLTAAVEAARQRDLGDGWAWSRRLSGKDITPLVACTLAAHGVETPAPAERAPLVVL